MTGMTPRVHERFYTVLKASRMLSQERLRLSQGTAVTTRTGRGHDLQTTTSAMKRYAIGTL
jgi:hypothetical protein